MASDITCPEGPAQCATFIQLLVDQPSPSIFFSPSSCSFSFLSTLTDCRPFTGEICGESLASLDAKCKALFVSSVENLDV